MRLSKSGDFRKTSPLNSQNRRLYCEFPNLCEDLLRLRSLPKTMAPFSRGRFFFFRQLSSSSTASSSSVKGVRRRLPSIESWKKAWRYFLWFPAVVFINDHVISLSPVNGISMRPAVLSPILQKVLIISLIRIQIMESEIGLFFTNFCSSQNGEILLY